MLRFLTSICFSFLLSSAYAQVAKDSLPYKLFKENLIIRSSIGYNTAPFRVKGRFGGENENLRYRANMSAVKGIGFSYKWISLGINFTLPGYLRNKEEFGETDYFDIDFSFEWRNWYFLTDFHLYQGFSLRDANRFSDELTTGNNSNQIRPKTGSASLGLQGYQFFNKQFSMKPAIGILGYYTEEMRSTYLKYTMSLHGVGDQSGYLMPWEYLNDPRSIIRSEGFSALDFGVVPGYTYINNINGWQYGGHAGVGAVAQLKFYNFEGTTRGFLGLAPRYDLRMHGGYNTDRWFVMVDAAFDNKSIRFNDIRFRQVYYYIRLSYGYRFEKKINQ
jgi:hypothetical protein